MSDQDDNLSLEALRSRVDKIDVPDDPEVLSTFISDISEQKLKDFRKSHKWAQQGPLSGFRPHIVNDFVRRSLTKLAAHHSERRKSLLFLWLVDHWPLLERVENDVSDDSLRDNILALLNDFSRNQVAWALRFSERESIQQALDNGLWEELQDEESPLVAQHSLRKLKKEHAALHKEKSKLESEVTNLEGELSDACSTVETKKREISRLKRNVESLKSKKDVLEEKRKELDQALNTAKGNLESQKREKRKVEDRLSKLQREMRSVFTSVADVLDIPSIPEEDPTAVAELTVEQIKKLQATCNKLRKTAKDLEEERNQLAPALPHVKRAWEERLDSFRQKVDEQLGALGGDLEPHTPVEDWKHWLNQERSLIFPLLDEIENPIEQYLADLKTVQSLLTLRWYLLEWVKLGMLRHLESTSILTRDSQN